MTTNREVIEALDVGTLRDMLRWALDNGVQGYRGYRIGQDPADGDVYFTTHDGTCERDVEVPEHLATALRSFVEYYEL